MGLFLKKLESTLDRVLGVFGGLVWAFVASLSALYCYGVFRYPFVIFVGACVAFVILFTILGLFLPRYFSCFFIPVFNGLANADGQGHPHNDDGYSWGVWVASVELFISMGALLVGTLFQARIAFAVGVILFIGYAIFAPRVFWDRAG